MKKLYRNDSEKIIAGICAGLADYINIDVTIVRLIFVVLFLMGTGGFWLYLILWIIIPLPPDHSSNSVEVTGTRDVEVMPEEDADVVDENK